ncbi:MAG: VWA domain-containing protein, partial [Thermoanaerobaculia bacterium]|nr:VWA domain-containing protein [Thermoanaerobaculia bacterium]
KSNLSAGLNAASKLLLASEPPKAIVLVDASPWNAGTDPLFNLPDFPVETVAIGDNGQTETLQKIAAQTGGSYNFAAEPSALIGIMLEIVERLGIAQIVAYGSRKVSNHQPYNLVGRVADGTETATFLVFWGDPEITYGVGSSPRFVTAELLDPMQKPAGVTPAWAGDGFAVFSVPQPTIGSWTSTSTYVGPGGCTFTNAILVA